MKSFSRQLSDLLSYAGYKSNSKLLPCAVQAMPTRSHPTLTYKCDIALRIYEEYKKEGFKFSEQGVTPMTIAQEILVYVWRSEDYEIDVDSFGNLMVRPSKEYFGRLEEKVVRSGGVRHEGIGVDGLAGDAWQKKGRKVFFGMFSPLNLSTLRMAYYSSILKRKTIMFGEKNKEDVIAIADLQSLSAEQRNILMEYRLIDDSTLEFNPSNKTLDIEPVEEILSFSLRHELIPFQHKYKHIFNSNTKILTFADIFPTITALKANQVSPSAIDSILSHTLNYKAETPIDLKHPPQPHKSLELLQQITSRNSQQRFLLLLDALYEDRILDLLSLKESQPLITGKSKPLQLLFSQLQMIL